MIFKSFNPLDVKISLYFVKKKKYFFKHFYNNAMFEISQLKKEKKEGIREKINISKKISNFHCLLFSIIRLFEVSVYIRLF